MTTLVCPQCGQEKKPEDFYPDKYRSSGISSYCRSCQRKRFDEIDKADPEKYALTNRLRSIRHLYKKQGVEGDFTLDQVLGLWEAQERLCYYCQEPLALGDISLDHKLPVERGGTHAFFNLAVACLPCNKEKGVRTEDEYRASPKN